MHTFRQLADSGHAVRAWCFRCARGGVVTPRPRWADLTLAEAAARFPCLVCRRSDEVLLVPASVAQVEGEITGERFVAAFYHAIRSGRKKPVKPFEPPWYWGRDGWPVN